MINIKHPKISIFVEKIKNYIKIKISEYYKNFKKNNNKIDKEDMNKK